MNVTLAQLNYTVGDFEGNYQKIKSVIEAHSKVSDLILFSELCLSGYYPFDLLDRTDFQAAQNKYLEKVKALTKIHDCAVLIGAYISQASFTGL